ncbi:MULTISPECIES: hypothetical protein [unclassified Streptomyces]|uniref:hypothetical protein n=1 Tax=unclassified Streptomyces TaxID=2593676 RepID=UPI00081F5A5F|nr:MULTISPECIES: hypothetical protein [unclassified Streptomyces]MYR97880.1 hypothetical protein [Streptomyces sp. SID4937]SCE31135.1 5-methylcytosine-specific restriction enzyme A [Streptomyces sp. ScaeMP-e83]
MTDASETTETAGTIDPGHVATRAEFAKAFGGGPQGGILPSKENVLLYADHKVSGNYGYHDGWISEENDPDPIFEYTGAGRVGHQVFTGRKGVGNSAVLDHVKNGRALRLFVAVGKVPGPSAARLHRYVGRFELDREEPFVVRQGIDEKKHERKVIVFRLRPFGSVAHVDEDNVPIAEKTEATLVEPDVTKATLIDPENGEVTDSLRAIIPHTKTEYRAARLSRLFQRKLKSEGHVVQRFQIRVKGTRTPLVSDLYDATDHVLYQVKGNARRESVRMAIGQLLDYRRYVKPAGVKLGVVFPEKPGADMVDLLDELEISAIYQSGASFKRAC